MIDPRICQESHISAVYRAICVMPEGMEDLLVSNEFTVLRPKPDSDVDPYYLWLVLRSSGVIAEWLSQSTGVGRHRVDWEMLSNQEIPLLKVEQQNEIGDRYRRAIALMKEAEECDRASLEEIAILGLESEKARDRMVAAKPPR